MTESTGSAPGRIFMSYRREDTAYPAGWLYDRLTSHFGGSQIFKDIDSIELGDDFVEMITSAVGSCDVLLALIGSRWLTITDRDGRRRLDNPGDFVRVEVEAALARKVRVIPILVDGAHMPPAHELPASLAGLAHRQALELSPNRFANDTARLLRVLDRTIAQAQEQARQQAEEAAAQRRRRQVEQLQKRIRERAAAQDWDAVVAASDQLATLDPGAADPDGLASAARDQVTRRQQARDNQSMGTAQRQELQDAIRPHSHRLDGVVTAQAIPADRAGDVSATSSRTKFVSPPSHFTARQAATYARMWRWRRITAVMAFLAALVALLKLFNVLAGTNPHPGATWADVTIAVHAYLGYILAGLSASAFAVTALMVKRTQGTGWFPATTCISIAVAAAAHFSLVRGWLGWFIVITLLTVAILAWWIGWSEWKEKKDFIKTLALDGSGMKLVWADQIQNRIEWSGVSSVFSTNSGISARLTLDMRKLTILRSRLKIDEGREGTIAHLFERNHFPESDTVIIGAIDAYRGGKHVSARASS